ncbi:unnamed protein product [Lasius platythorax]|uniref:Uncharacterized protein n=1 Tax=Lasius platythorax TaxID=488582 RepID=A0AAV2NAD1_9HYME
MPLLLIVPSRLRNGRQRGGGGVTPNKAAEIRKPVPPVPYPCTKRREMHPCLENRRATSTMNLCYECIRFRCERRALLD